MTYNKFMKDFLHHLFIPRESNNHRSKFLHHQSLLLVIVFLLVGLSSSAVVHKNYPSVLGISANISVQDLLSLTNQKRQENGLGNLTLNTQLSEAAQKKGEYMFAHNFWAHVAPDGTTPWVFIKNSGYEYLYAGENLARGFTTAPDATNAWMASPTHRENLLSPNYKDVGFAVLTGSLTGSDTVLIVQMFGTRYVAKNEDASAPEMVVVQSTPIPTPAPTFVQVLPTKAAPIVSQAATNSPAPAVAAIQNNPLIDSKSAKMNVGLFVLILFIAVLILDAVIVERKKIARVVAHNLDHIIFLLVILLAAILIGRGITL